MSEKFEEKKEHKETAVTPRFLSQDYFEQLGKERKEMKLKAKEKSSNGIRHVVLVNPEDQTILFDHVVRCTRKEWEAAKKLFNEYTEHRQDLAYWEIAEGMKHHFIVHGQLLSDDIKKFMRSLRLYQNQKQFRGLSQRERKSYEWYRELLEKVESFDDFLDQVNNM